MKSFVAIGNDLTVAITKHDANFLSDSQVCFEAPTPIYWPPGMATGHNKLTATVVHQKLAMATKGHDCGPGIPHVHLMPGPLTPVATLKSSRKSTFAGATVRADKQPLAACGLLNLTPTPMLSCADPIPLPMLGAVTMATKNTVTFGMTPADIKRGIGEMAAEMLIEWIGGKGNSPRGKIIAWSLKNLAKNVKKFAEQGHKWATEGGALDFTIEASPPEGFEPLHKARQGIQRDENGDWKLVYGQRLLHKEFEITFNYGTAEFEVKNKSAEFHGDGDVSVRRDGKKVRYNSSWDDDPSQHGRPQIVEDEG